VYQRKTGMSSTIHRGYIVIAASVIIYRSFIETCHKCIEFLDIPLNTVSIFFVKVTEFNGIESMTIKLGSRLFHSIFHPKNFYVIPKIGIGIWGILEKDREGGKNLEQQ
jgi:hypothetical protein